MKKVEVLTIISKSSRGYISVDAVNLADQYDEKNLREVLDEMDYTILKEDTKIYHFPGES